MPTTELRIGSLFSGYGGLEQGVASVLGGRTAWVSDIDKGACMILAHRYPDAPNLGDISAVDWSEVEDVDVITGGFPCQDVSHAGRRAGLIRGSTRTGLWAEMCRAIDAKRPRLVVAENVRGLLSAKADSDMEPCPWCMGDGSGAGLRALGAVLGDLADIGYDAGWLGVRASDVGAAHQRFRVFIVAHPTGHPNLAGLEGRGPCERADQRPARASGVGPDLSLLPTPAVNDMGAAYTPDEWDAWTDRMKAEHGNGNGHGKSLAIEAQRLLPTPKATNNENRPSPGYDNKGEVFYHIMREDRWGDYAPAIARWEHALGRPAPEPTNISEGWIRDRARRLAGKSKQRIGFRGSIRRFLTPQQQLSPAFVEWLMGLPAGWVTDVPGITRNQALKALGNGVVPQQAAAAVEALLHALSTTTEGDTA